MSASARDKVFRIVGTILEVPVDSITEDTSPDNVKGWDSLRHMKLMLALEEELDMQFTADQIVDMNSVGLILAVLEEAARANPRA